MRKWLVLDIVLLIAAVALAAAISLNIGGFFLPADRPTEEELAKIRVNEAVKISAHGAGLLSDMSRTGLAEMYPKQTEKGKERGIAVLMYHNVYDPKDYVAENIDPLDPPPTLNDNYISIEVLREELKYLKDEGYSFPSWKEVRRYVDGEIDLPEKSVVLTFDDGTDGFMRNGVPLLEEFKIPATAFVIASRNGRKWREFAKDHPLIDVESHSYDMHKAGGNIGHDGIMTALLPEDIVKDLKRSQKVLGNSEAFAYPYGDFDPEGKCRDAVEESGFLVGFTTVYGKVFPEMDPCLLPRVRVNGSTSLEYFKTII